MKKFFFLLAIILIISLVFSLSALASEKEEGKHEKESAWRFTGWQTVFSFLAIGYYIIVSLSLLPKIAAKELEEHH